MLLSAKVIVPTFNPTPHSTSLCFNISKSVVSCLNLVVDVVRLAVSGCLLKIHSLVLSSKIILLVSLKLFTPAAVCFCVAVYIVKNIPTSLFTFSKSRLPFTSTSVSKTWYFSVSETFLFTSTFCIVLRELMVVTAFSVTADPDFKLFALIVLYGVNSFNTKLPSASSVILENWVISINRFLLNSCCSAVEAGYSNKGTLNNFKSYNIPFASNELFKSKCNFEGSIICNGDQVTVINPWKAPLIYQK